MSKIFCRFEGKVSQDRIEYYAAFDGKVEVSNGVLTVLKISTIPGDVDLSVGNLDVKGDLEILGNVRAGMIVKAKGNITVKGLVEAAEIEAGKDVLIKGGVLGGGKARIQGGGNVYAQFIENAAIKCGNCVQADSIVNSIVEAYNDVNIFGKTSAIIGGMITANRVIRTKYIGSSAQVLTRLHVGIEASTLAEIQQKELRFAENEKELDKIEKAMKMNTTIFVIFRYQNVPEPMTLNGDTLIIPFGHTAPGFVVPKFVVPTNGFT